MLRGAVTSDRGPSRWPLAFSARERVIRLERAAEKNHTAATVKLGRELLAIRVLAVQLLEFIEFFVKLLFVARSSGMRMQDDSDIHHS